MFINGPRNETVIQDELDTVQDYCDRTFGIGVDYAALQLQIGEMIQQRIADYIFQRFRDWPIRDLLALQAAVSTRTESEEAEAPRPRGRPPKSKGHAGQEMSG